METYAPTDSLATFRLPVAIAVFNGRSMCNLDIITAFLYGDIDFEVYMGIPDGVGLDPKRFVFDPCASHLVGFYALISPTNRFSLLCRRTRYIYSKLP
jgi:hypothetical protein